MFDSIRTDEHDEQTEQTVPRPDDGSSRAMVGDPVAGLVAAVERVAREDRDGWSGPARGAHLQELLAARERFEAEVLRAVGEWHAADGWVDDDLLSPVSWLAEHGAMTQRDASDLLRTARLVHGHDRTRDALAVGDVPARSATLLARAAQHREAVFEEQEETLVAAAGELRPERLRKLLRTWQCLADDVLDRAPAEVQESRWHLHAVTTFGGSVALRGLLDPEGGAVLLAALDALDAPDPVDGVRAARSLPQRRADALVRLAQGEGRRHVNVDVIVDLARLRGAPDGGWAGDLEALRGEIVGIGPIGRAALETLACDGNVGRVVMRGSSMVLDLGRRTPTVSASKRRALAARDGGCVVPGCDAPPHWCDAHHTQPWTLDGPTDLDQLELRCRRHHRAAHHHEIHGGRGRPPPSRLAA